jgi:hypothetical protein
MFDVDVMLSLEDPDYPGLRIGGEFMVLQRHLEFVTASAPHARDQFALRFGRALESRYAGLNIADLTERREELLWIMACVVPQAFFNPFVISLSATLELAILEIADYARKREAVKLRLMDLGRNPNRERLHTYLEAIYREEVALPGVSLEFFDDLQEVRNCVAHANASLRFERSESRLRRIRSIAAKGIGVEIRQDVVTVSPEFLGSALESSAKYVSGLLHWVARRYGV